MNYTHFVSVAGLVSNDNGEILLINSPRRCFGYGNISVDQKAFAKYVVRK